MNTERPGNLGSKLILSSDECKLCLSLLLRYFYGIAALIKMNTTLHVNHETANVTAKLNLRALYCTTPMIDTEELDCICVDCQLLQLGVKHPLSV